MTEDEMIGWHHQLNGDEFEQTLGDSEGQGNLMCCSPWGCKESDTTEQLNNKLCYRTRGRKGFKKGCCLVTKSCPTHYDPMDCSISSLPVPNYPPEFAQVNVH